MLYLQYIIFFSEINTGISLKFSEISEKQIAINLVGVIFKLRRQVLKNSNGKNSEGLTWRKNFWISAADVF